MTREALLDKVPLSDAQIFRIQGELDPEEAAAKYEFALRQSFRLEGAEIPIFDVLALGMGPDGHTASLFPHTEGLHETMRMAIANHVAQKDAWRVTLTWPVINRARDVFFLIEGADKAAPLKQVFLGPYDPGIISFAADPARQPAASHYSWIPLPPPHFLSPVRTSKADWRSLDDPGRRRRRHQGRPGPMQI